ncbi:NBS-LRR type resistance protein [Cucumis melo var. makuwa]|uniref:NBS-LRR type resistance protein n=1 Tax=Cucumis melo var. makuwa TaxID=1194695 RepID=A0A5D3CZM1_CUCMM|nr:NBS-LRR type resistance protein [Cucumis melo var. makuwa]
MAFTHPSCPSSVCPSLGTLHKQSSGSVERTHQSHDLEGCTYQSSDPEGYTYQSSDFEGCTYQSSDPEGYTSQSSDPEGCTYQSSDPEGYTYQFAVGCLANDATEGGWASTDTVERRTHDGVWLRETEREIGNGWGRGERTLEL